MKTKTRTHRLVRLCRYRGEWITCIPNKANAGFFWGPGLTTQRSKHSTPAASFAEVKREIRRSFGG